MEQLNLFDIIPIVRAAQRAIARPTPAIPPDMVVSMYGGKERGLLDLTGSFGIVKYLCFKAALGPGKVETITNLNVTQRIADRGTCSILGLNDLALRWEYDSATKHAIKGMEKIFKRYIPLQRDLTEDDVNWALEQHNAPGTADPEDRDITTKENVLFDFPLVSLKDSLREQINRARWSGKWDQIPTREHFRELYDNIEGPRQALFMRMMERIMEDDAFPYQKFDAAIVAAVKRALLTHNMGLGKTRITLLASKAVNKPTLIIALPRLVEVVWKKELSVLNMNDAVVLERPRRSKIVPRRIRGQQAPEDGTATGYAMIGRTRTVPTSRRDGTTADIKDPSRVKVMSYNALLPTIVRYDEVICPTCKRTHNQEKCPTITITINDTDSTVQQRATTNSRLIDEAAAAFRKGQITQEVLAERVIRHIGSSHFTVNKCGVPINKSICPNCRSYLGRRFTVGRGSTLTEKHIPSHSCMRCGYSARLWIPSMARRLRKLYKNGMIIMDESQAVKNWHATRTKCALSMRPKHRILTSGTPATTDVARDLYNQLEWLIGYGPRFPFKNRNDFECFIHDAEKSQDYSKVYRLLDPVQIRRDIDDYGVNSEVELPPFNERRFALRLSKQEEANYRLAQDNIADWIRRRGNTASELDLFSQMWILRRGTIVPFVDNPSVQKSTKLEALPLQLQACFEQGKKVLIGSEMLDVLDAIQRRLPNDMVQKVQRIDGSVPIKAANKTIALFQDVCPECQIALVEDEQRGDMACPLCDRHYNTPQALIVSRTAVREGVTLNKASTVMLCDPSWTYADMYQFWKRAHRIGARYNELDIIYMESPQTIDERMYDEAERRKVSIAKAINRKDIETSEKVDIHKFVSDLLGITVRSPKSTRNMQ